ncbi:carboxylesterase/lipase family protein [Sphingobium amiense]|uniref:Carboxylic ester hydrolase n=1 Tax=Sphingobium amiense TaxID=135719 RepID=A0A494VWJ8_9SPHN|nr:carboxylesterase/lipase family protein [Sphingobium amiense]BBD96783.1 carboxylesterase/lipase family protein [Sphingobium amiense]
MFKSPMQRRGLLKYAGFAGLGLGAGLSGSTALFAATGDAPVVTTRAGRLRGTTEGASLIFRGVPYAQPPVGPLRFRAPRPVRPWKGVRDALQFGAPSVQKNPAPPTWVDPLPASEDCLYLNVWAPKDKAPGPRPVMVWFHGGAYTSGSGGLAMYDGQHLSEAGDVVVVTVNHRLNIFGYLWLGDIDPRFTQDASAGQQDLVAALRWVSENIAAFGGDPRNVTIFGESGGGAKVNALLATPSAKGLFHKAIVQSGSQSRVMERAEATEVSRYALEAAGFDPAHPAGLESLTSEALLKGADAATKRFGILEFQPVIDGVFMPHQTWSSGAPPEGLGIPLMIGTNRHEGAGFVSRMHPEPADDAQMHQRYETALFVPKLTPDQWTPFLAGYRQAMPGASRTQILVAMATDGWLWQSAIHQAKAKAEQGGAPLFMYEFGWETPAFGGSWSLHALEIPFVFGHLTYGVAWDGTDSDAQRAQADPSGDRFRLSAQMMQAWAAFAHRGDPSTPALPWPQYDLARRATMIFDRQSHVELDPRTQRRALVEPLPLQW